MQPHLSLPKWTRLLVTSAAAAIMLNTSVQAGDYPGFVKVERFDDISGGVVANLTANPKYTNNAPDFVTFVDSLYYLRTPAGDNYGTRITGYIVPTQTASYIFYFFSDDAGQFFLSTDAAQANLRLIAAEPQWNPARTWTGTNADGTINTGVVGRRPVASNVEAGQSYPNISLPKPLTANQRYYFQILHKEATGGEDVGVAWSKVGDPAPVDGTDAQIPGANLLVVSPSTLTFALAPKNQAVEQGRSVTFSTTAIGTPTDADPTTFTYQWLVNGTAIADGTGSDRILTIPSAALADNGKKYSLRVTTAGGLTGTSPEATLTVTTDATPPTIANVRTSDTFKSARVTFTEAVNNAAVTPSNYTLSGGLTVTDANFAIVVNDVNSPENPKNPTNPANRVTVILTTSTQTDAGVYDLTVNANVKDLIGNAISPNTAKMYANTFKSGLLLYKRWTNQGHRNFQTLLADPVYDTPSSVQTRTIAEEWPGVQTDIPNQVYLAMLTGFFIPATTGDYIFFYSVDNDGWLYLSTDENPLNQVLIAADIGWQNNRVWTGAGGDAVKRRGDTSVPDPGMGPFENRSDEMLTSPRALAANWTANRPFDDVKVWPTLDANGNAKITLTAGKRYPIISYHSEPEGGHSEMTFKLAGEPDPVNGTVTRMTGNLIGALVDPSALPPVITNQPVGVDFTLGGTLSLRVGADSAQPPTYQWYRGLTAISGATNSTLTITSASVSAVGSYYVIVSNANGSATSQTVFAFTAATPPPRRTYQQDGSGLVVIEAENYYDSIRAADGHVWYPQTDRAGYSGASYLQALPDSAINRNVYPDLLTVSPRLDYKVNFTKTGTHYVWLRGGDPAGAGAGDSVHAGIDGAIPASGVRIDGAPSFNIATGWNWVGNIQGDTRASLEVTTVGEHTVGVWMREDGFSLDKLLLTTDAAFTPTGTGPAESARVGGSAPTISVARNATGGPVITYTGTLQSSATVSGSYTAVTGATSPHTPTATQAAQFFRAAQ